MNMCYAARGLSIRPAAPGDMDDMMRIYASARAYMAASGNPNQWNGGYPSRELLLGDIAKRQLYVCESGGRVCAAFVLARGKDPTYDVIEDGQWPGDGEYVTIHRIASDGSARGVFEACMAFALERCGRVRVDTHDDNHVMQNLLTGHGFARCGIIHIADGSPRIAYQYGADAASLGDEALKGGRITQSVLKRGGTVHRSRCANSEFVREVLVRLEEQGADFAPRWLGADEQGREVFSFLPGGVPDNLGAFSDEQCAAAARMIGRMHRMLAGMPGCAAGETVGHRDLSPCNFTFVDGMPAGIIDWDAAAVCRPVYDLAYAMWMWLDVGNDEQSAEYVARRMEVMRAAYGGDFAMRDIYAAMLEEMARVGRGIFPTEEQTRATNAWTRSCAAWCERALRPELGI